MTIGQLMRGLAINNGVYISRVTPKDELREFFSIVRPVSIQTDLIRVGGTDDGGYLIPDDLDGIEACFSPGVAETAEFEEALANRGIRSHLADYSVSQSPVKNKMLHFEKRYLGIKNDNMYVRLEDWVTTNVETDNDLILQMDIEGSEFPVIFDSPLNVLSKFRILVIEFHQMQQLFSKDVYPHIRAAFLKLKQNFSVVHIHPNNAESIVSCGEFDVPPTIEFTFFRNDRVIESENELTFPHRLDVPNTKEKSDVILPECWR
jgi:hypothetical protein